MFGFKKNMGILDRILRFLMSGVTIYLGITQISSIVFQVLLVMLGLFYFAVGLTGRSPFYRLIGGHTDTRID
ncbi:DUF2892 domain-containing protein [Vicingaceae bacterium]|nr:DUF2892 domain-containing protein [Vicingaceae bacterium]